MKNLLKFGKLPLRKIVKLLFPSSYILIVARLYFSQIQVGPDSWLYGNASLQTTLFSLHRIYFHIIEPILILLALKLLFDLLLSFTKE